MKAHVGHHVTLLVSFLLLVLSPPAHGRQQPATPLSFDTRDEREAFLANAGFTTDPPADGRPSWRARLGDGTRQHDASVVTEDGTGPTRRNYRFNQRGAVRAQCGAVRLSAGRWAQCGLGAARGAGSVRGSSAPLYSVRGSGVQGHGRGDRNRANRQRL